MHKLLLAFTLVLAANLAAIAPSLSDLPSVAAPPVAHANGFTQVTAHRGNSASAPENTLGAMLKAVNDGAGYAELDVQETADGVLILMHDSSARRTTGINKNIWEIQSGELLGASAGSWFGKEYEGEKVPTLEQVIHAVKGRMKLNIELKNNGHQKQLAEKTVQLLEQTDFVKECTVTSFDIELLKTVKRLNKGIKTGLIVSEKKGDSKELFKNDAYDVISIAYPLVDDGFIRGARQAHKEVYAWTVNDKASMELMLRLGVDSIITNVPDQLIALLGQQP